MGHHSFRPPLEAYHGVHETEARPQSISKSICAAIVVLNDDGLELRNQYAAHNKSGPFDHHEGTNFISFTRRDGRLRPVSGHYYTDATRRSFGELCFVV